LSSFGRGWRLALLASVVPPAWLGAQNGPPAPRQWAPPNVTGRVALADDAPLPGPVEIVLVCGPRSRSIGMTDAKGNFNIAVEVDATIRNSDPPLAPVSDWPTDGFLVESTQSGNRDALAGCVLRIVLDGYRTNEFDFSRARAAGPNLEVGILTLHPLAQTRAATVSVNELAAPKAARKALDKARIEIGKGNLAKAEEQLRKAIQAYPAYAAAWQELGDVLVHGSRTAEGRAALQRAVDNDPKSAKAYLSLARLAAANGDWRGARDHAEAVLKLDASSYPQAYFYDAEADYNLGNRELALERAQQAVKLDERHLIPWAEELLGILYAERGDFQAAAEQFRLCVAHAHPGMNLDAVKVREAAAEASAAAAR